jgi:ParB family chromosome partitioning protein
METMKRGLGRGLEALIPDTTALRPEDGDRILSLPVESIEPNPLQPRRDFAPEELDALADSIRSQGLLQPIVVRSLGGARYQLVAGERRWRAAARAGFERLPALVRKTADSEMLPLALVENLLREDLNPIEEGVAYQRLLDEAEWTQELVASKVGKSRAHVANTLRLLRLPEDVRSDIASGRITPGHARALLVCETPEAMYALRQRILTLGMTVREAESIVSPPASRKERQGRGRLRTNDRDVSPETLDLEERLQRLFGTAVRIDERSGKGRLSFEFFSYDDLGRLTDLLFAAGDRSPLAPRG